MHTLAPVDKMFPRAIVRAVIAHHDPIWQARLISQRQKLRIKESHTVACAHCNANGGLGGSCHAHRERKKNLGLDQQARAGHAPKRKQQNPPLGRSCGCVSAARINARAEAQLGSEQSFRLGLAAGPLGTRGRQNHVATSRTKAPSTSIVDYPANAVLHRP
ncbi:hypothetical protein PSP6_530079 [Paraburkholderia tropica]|nr:hypothetical protein PSP6_530079 [Paraburkholderia tropica]